MFRPGAWRAQTPVSSTSATTTASASSASLSSRAGSSSRRESAPTRTSPSCWKSSTPRSSSSAPTTARSRSPRRWSCCPTCRPASSRSPTSAPGAATRSTSSSGPAWTPSSSPPGRSRTWSARRRRKSDPRPVRRGLGEESRWGNRWLALTALLAGAAVLRLVGVEYGLPFPLLNPDEANIVPRAWRMTHGGGADPDWFDYPSLLIYAIAPFENWADEPSYLAGRLVVVVLGVAGIAAAWWLGDRAYGVTAGFVAAAVTAVDVTHVAYSRMAVTDVLLTLGVAVALVLMIAGRLPAAGVAIGIAAGFKYPAFTLLAPLAVAGWGQWRRLAVSAALSLLAFVATSPFFAVHLGEALGDVRGVQEWGRRGWLGFENDHVLPNAFVDRLLEGMGPALIVAAVGLVLALVGSIRAAEPLTRTDTRVVAHDWMRVHVTPGVLVAADPSTAPPNTVRVLQLALPGPGRPPDPERDVRRLRRLNVGYVVVTGAVADRVRAAGDRYPRDLRFYRDLERQGKRRFYRTGTGKLAGPWVAVYEL